jgi:two-component system cell cycle sensor histidine kinase/response regulator CckA
MSGLARRLRILVEQGDPWLLRVGLAAILVVTMLVLLATMIVGVDPAGPAAAGIALAALAGIALMTLARTEKAAQTAKRHAEVMSHAADALPGGAVVIDAEGRLVHANAVFQIMVGQIDEYPINALAARLTQDEATRMRFERLAAAAALGQVAQEEVSVTSPTGKTAWWEISAHPVPALSGYNLWTVSDVTARREIESVVREEQAKLVDFLENAPIGFYSVDAEGRFEFVNQTLAAWLESTPEELVIGGARLHQFLAAPPKPGTPPYDPFGAEAAGKVNEVTMRGRRGRLFQAAISQTIVGGGAAGPLRTRSVVRDLTPEHAMAEALRRSEHRYQQLFENAPVVIASLDEQGRILDCNPALRQLLGPGQDPIGRPLVELIDPRDRKEAEARIRATLAGRAAGGAREVRLADGRNRIASLYLSRQVDASGATGLMASFVDTTEQKSLELQFAQSQKMQAVGQLAGGIAHDFNNLLTAMIGFCDLLLLRHRPGDQSFADIMQIKQNANRAANLVRQLLAFSRQQTLQPRVLNVTDALAELSHLLRRLIGEGIELRMIHGRDLGLVRVDQGQLEQVIINLAVNARDAMNHGGVLTIQTSARRVDAPQQHGVETMPAGDYVAIEVIDTGTGIPPEIIDRIFEPFFSTKEVGQGTGLGLSTVYGIVKQTGGFIFVDSTPGQGTTFRIFLPVHVGQADEKGAAADAEKALAGDLTGSGIVLLVEDEDPVRMFSARALRNKGYKVIEAKSGDAALELINKQIAERPASPYGTAGIDLLITDVVMPNMDGPTLVQHARKRLPGLRVICISGYAEETLAKRIGAAGDVHFLPKPFSLKQLAAKVKDVMRQPSQAAD